LKRRNVVVRERPEKPELPPAFPLKLPKKIGGIFGSFDLWVENLSEGRFSVLLLSPLIIFLIAVIGIPIARTIWLSLHQYLPARPWMEYKFIGLVNYVSLLRDPTFMKSLIHSFYFTVLNIILMLLLAIPAALLVSREFRGRIAVRTILLLPWAVPIAVAGTTFKFMYNGEYGVINYLLKSIGIIKEYVPWLMSYDHVFDWMYSSTAMNAIISAAVWRTLPFSILMILAALESIPPDYYKMAKVNGANSWQIFRHVTFPLILPGITVVVLWRAITAMRIYGIIDSMTAGGPGRITETLQILTIRTFFVSRDLGKGTAMAVMTMLFTLVFIIFYLALLQYVQRKRR